MTAVKGYTIYTLNGCQRGSRGERGPWQLRLHPDSTDRRRAKAKPRGRSSPGAGRYAMQHGWKNAETFGKKASQDRSRSRIARWERGCGAGEVPATSSWSRNSIGCSLRPRCSARGEDPRVVAWRCTSLTWGATSRQWAGEDVLTVAAPSPRRSATIRERIPGKMTNPAAGASSAALCLSFQGRRRCAGRVGLEQARPRDVVRLFKRGVALRPIAEQCGEVRFAAALTVRTSAGSRLVTIVRPSLSATSARPRRDG